MIPIAFYLNQKLFLTAARVEAIQQSVQQRTFLHKGQNWNLFHWKCKTVMTVVQKVLTKFLNQVKRVIAYQPVCLKMIMIWLSWSMLFIKLKIKSLKVSLSNLLLRQKIIPKILRYHVNSLVKVLKIAIKIFFKNSKPGLNGHSLTCEKQCLIWCWCYTTMNI